MNRRKWFKIYHGLPGDVTLAVVAKRAGFNRAEMLALWLALIDHANQQDPPGSIAGLDCDGLSLQLELDIAQIGTALDALREKKRLDRHQRIVGWDRYQSASTRRVQNLRARRRAASDATPKPAVRPVPRPAPPARNVAEIDSPAAIAARRARLQQNNGLIIGRTPPQGG